MPPNSQDKILVACPHCGHQQRESRAVFSTVCKKCGQHIRVQEVFDQPRKVAEAGPAQRRINCFDCNAELDVPVSAQSTMCKRCSRYIDLKDYRVANAVSKNFKTKGMFVIEPAGYVFNTEVIASDVSIKGRLHGKLAADRLTVFSTAEIKGSFKAGHLIVPAENCFRWKEQIALNSAEIAGELAANLRAEGAVILKSTARLFGDIEAGSLVVEEGAVVVGNVRCRRSGGVGVAAQPTD